MEKSNDKIIERRLYSPAFYIAMLGAIKLVTDAFGYQLISDEQVNSIANALAALATVVGVAKNYD